MKNKDLGKIGENIAKNFLINKGFEFVTENYFTRYGEIDLIFKEKNILVFVEVKTRIKKQDLDISINYKKVKKLYTSAEIFIEKEQIFFQEMRFDAILINISETGQVVEIGHRPNFF